MEHTIESLRRKGYKVRVIHGKLSENLDADIPPNIRKAAERYTKIEVTEPVSGLSVAGYAFCSVKEGWNRKEGNRIALTRAMDLLFLAEDCNPASALLYWTEHPGGVYENSLINDNSSAVLYSPTPPYPNIVGSWDSVALDDYRFTFNPSANETDVLNP